MTGSEWRRAHPQIGRSRETVLYRDVLLVTNRQLRKSSSAADASQTIEGIRLRKQAVQLAE